MSIDVKYDTTPCDGTPGQPWEDFKRRLRNVATRSDDRGFSLADHFDDTDEGGGTFAKMRGHLMNINASLRGEIAKSMQHATGELKRIISRMSRY